MTNKEKIIKVTKQLYPTGRAFKMPYDSDLYTLHRALAESEKDAYEDAASLMDVILPDNSEFTSDDATDWERRLAITTNLATPLADRKLAIKRKMASPGTQPAKGHYLYLQTQLQNAGFSVYVRENLKPIYPDGFEYYNPADVNVTVMGESQLDDDMALGGRQLKWYVNHLAINSIENQVDTHFDFGDILNCTFFIGGQNWGTFANVASSREDEFRQLVLSLKQPQDIGILLINYT